MCIFTNAYSAWVSGSGEYYFGPETSELQACSAAEERSKLDSLKKFYGETLSFNQSLSCRENKFLSSDSDDCQLNKILWSQIGGEIKSTSIVKKDILESKGSRICKIESVSDIAVSKGKPDPNFDVGVSINQTAFRPGEKIYINLEPSAPMYVAVFNWVPYLSDDKQILKLFPNDKDGNSHLIKKRRIPDVGYSLEIYLPEKIPSSRSFLDEYLLVVATKEPVAWLEAYSFNEFKSRISEFSLDRIRYVKRGYQLLIPNNQLNREIP